MQDIKTVKRNGIGVIRKLTGSVPDVKKEPIPETQPSELLIWHNRKNAKAGNKTKCIVIDKYNHWHENVFLDLRGRDTSEYSWCYYGVWYPVLIEGEDGILLPYIQTDIAGESPKLLYIATKAAAYKNYMKLPDDLIRKIQIGLMVLLAIGVLFLIYILINQ